MATVGIYDVSRYDSGAVYGPAGLYFEITLDIARDGTYSPSNAAALINAYVASATGGVAMSLFTGLTQPYQEVAEGQPSTFTFNNDGGAFNLEDVAAAFASILKLDTWIRVRLIHATGTYTLYHGKLQAVSVDAGIAKAPKFAVINAVDPWKDNDADFTPPLLLDATVDEMLDEVFAEGPYWPYESAYWLLGVEDCSELGETTVLAGETRTDFDTGIQVLGYVGDGFGREQSVTRRSMILSLVQAELGGRFFWDARRALWKFFNRHHDALNPTSVDTFTSADIYDVIGYTPRAVRYNDLTLFYTPRAIGAAGTVVWSLNSVPFPMTPGETRVFRGSYSVADKAGVTVGVLPDTGIQPVMFTDFTATEDDSDPLSTLRTNRFRVGEVKWFGTSFEVGVEHYGSGTDWITKFQLRATPVFQYQQEFVRALNGPSIRDSSRIRKTLNMPLLDNKDDAQQTAEYLVQKNGAIMSSVRAVAFKLREDDSALVGRVLTCQNGDRITLQLDAYDHDADYTIVGQGFNIQAGAAYFDALWVLEPVASTVFWLLGEAGASELGETTVLAF